MSLVQLSPLLFPLILPTFNLFGVFRPVFDSFLSGPGVSHPDAEDREEHQDGQQNNAHQDWDYHMTWIS